MEAQKSSQAMQHFLPKRISSSSASSRPRPALTQQTAKPTPTVPEPWPPEVRRNRGCSRSARRYPFPKRQGPQPKIALDLAPQKSSWKARQKEEGSESHYRCTTRKQSLLCLSCRGKCVYGSSHIVRWCPTAVIADKIKHIHFQKESKNLFLPTISILPLFS